MRHSLAWLYLLAIVEGVAKNRLKKGIDMGWAVATLGGAMNDLFEGLSKSERCEVLRSMWPDGIRFERGEIAFGTRSVSFTSNHRQRLSYKKWKKASACSLPVDQFTAMEDGAGNVTFNFTGGMTYRINKQ